VAKDQLHKSFLQPSSDQAVSLFTFPLIN